MARDANPVSLKRTCLALVVAPAVAGAIGGIYIFATVPPDFLDTNTFADVLINGTSGSIIFFLALGYFLMFTVGLLAYLMLQKLRMTHFTHYIAAGAVGGALAAAVTLTIVLAQFYSAKIDIGVGFTSLVRAPIYGAVFAAIAWLIRRPDRDPTNPGNPTP